MSECRKIVITHEENPHTVETSNLILEIEENIIRIKQNYRDIYNDFDESRVYMTVDVFDKIVAEVKKYKVDNQVKNFLEVEKRLG